MDVRPGGAWRFVSRDSSGNEYAFNSVYREVVPPERLVHTFEFERMAGHFVLETVTLEELAALPGRKARRTKLTVRSLFQTVEDRNGMLESGMEEGATETMDHLGELLRKCYYGLTGRALPRARRSSRSSSPPPFPLPAGELRPVPLSPAFHSFHR